MNSKIITKIKDIANYEIKDELKFTVVVFLICGGIALYINYM